MKGAPVLLDSAALSVLASPPLSGPPDFLRAVLQTAWEQRREVLVPAVVCAESCRGTSRTREVESLLSRHNSGSQGQSPVGVVNTDFELARTVGLILHTAGTGSKDLVDAHLIAICVARGGGLIVTSDPGDMHRLAAPFVGVRIVVRGISP